MSLVGRKQTLSREIILVVIQVTSPEARQKNNPLLTTAKLFKILSVWPCYFGSLIVWLITIWLWTLAEGCSTHEDVMLCAACFTMQRNRYQWRLVSEQSPSRTPIHDSSEICEKWGHVPYMCMLSIGFHAICKDHWNCWQTVKFCLGMLILSVYEFLYLQKKKKGKKESVEGKSGKTVW